MPDEDPLAAWAVPVEALAAFSFLVPRRGETPWMYRDRVLPVVIQAVDPYRRRLADTRIAFEADANLTAAQRALLQEAVDRAAEALVDRAFQAALSGELVGPRLRASRAVALARDVITIIDDANRSFHSSLSEEQRAIAEVNRFDLVEYLFVATRWEDIIPGLQVGQ